MIGIDKPSSYETVLNEKIPTTLLVSGLTPELMLESYAESIYSLRKRHELKNDTHDIRELKHDTLLLSFKPN